MGSIDDFTADLLSAKTNLESAFTEQLDKFRINYFKDAKKHAEALSRDLQYRNLKLHLDDDRAFLEVAHIDKVIAQNAIAFFDSTLVSLESDPRAFKKFRRSILFFKSEVGRDKETLAVFVNRIGRFQFYLRQAQKIPQSLVMRDLFSLREEIESLTPGIINVYMKWIRNTVVVAGVKPEDAKTPPAAYST